MDMNLQEAYHTVFGLNSKEENEIEKVIHIYETNNIAFICENGKVSSIEFE
jgi:low affinity Fe/Cu permease